MQAHPPPQSVKASLFTPSHEAQAPLNPFLWPRVTPFGDYLRFFCAQMDGRQAQ